MNADILDVYSFFTGVPDSQLKPLCCYLSDRYGTNKQHLIAANEGNCTAIAAGYYLATGKIPVIYMQNSGIGNAINPIASLLNNKVYGIPCLFIVGWRGEPGVHDEPQHIFQGEVTLKLLELMDISAFVIDRHTQKQTLLHQLDLFRPLFKTGRSAALIVKKDAFTYTGAVKFANEYYMNREEIIRHIIKHSQDDVTVTTTGKASRELYEIRNELNHGHDKDFLTVGSMGHASSVALGIAMYKPERRIWCIDGDGAALMHMGAMAVIGAKKPPNLVHIVINNAAHETVGGMPTVANDLNWPQIAKGCGYPEAASVQTYEALDLALERACGVKALSFIEAQAALGARDNLGRPLETPHANMKRFMAYLASDHPMQS